MKHHRYNFKYKSATVTKKVQVKTRNSWGGVKPYTRIETPKTVYRRKGRRREVLAG